ncbi:MAG: 2-hydroxyglutaryl-CoA dehydratase [Candidatus Aminicenantes bacterium]|nr:2-hydroxyglutaryl-CoA dehydratase [Candidatus Aminicenantes bacterium]
MRNAYLGIDVGSTSVKCVLLDKESNIIDFVYMKNKGIIESVIECLSTLEKRMEIAACGITGSGRNFTNVLVGGDIVKTEVLAHSVAALEFYPDVRTIFEIGGEDCKLMIVEDGILVNFNMNNICAGGTGAMIEAIASRMGIAIEDVGELAFQSKNQLEMPGKCGIFCQSAVVNKLNSGVNKSDILMGVCRALIRNYLTICKGNQLEPPYVFQGATAQNEALVRALEEELSYPVIVPEQCALMGAIGIAMMAMEEVPEKTKFKGFDAILSADYDVRYFSCSDCENRCEVIQVYQDNELAGCIGSKCCKWNKIIITKASSEFMGLGT